MNCPACGLLNDPGARVCRNCGMPLGAPTDPLRGVSTRPMDLPAERRASIGAAVGLLAVVLILGGASVLVLGGDGFLSGGGRIVAGGSPGPSGTLVAGGPASPGPSGGTSAGPGATPVPGGTLTRTPFTCEDAVIADATAGRWRLTRVSSEEQRRTDRVTLLLARQGQGDDQARVELEWLSPREAAKRYQVDQPTGGRALVLTFKGPISAGPQDPGTVRLPAIRSLDVSTGKDGLVRAVLGIRGQGCARLSATGWEGAGPGETAEIELDVRR
jgi:hypothetical protein